MRFSRTFLAIFAISILFTAIPTLAQESSTGIWIGINRTSFTTNDTQSMLEGGNFSGLANDAEDEAYTRFAFGLFSSSNNPGLLGYRVDLSFTQKGAALDYDEDDITVENKLSYIQLDALPRLQIPMTALRPTLYAGPYIAYLIDSGGSIATGSGTFDLPSPEYKNLDWGITFGGGLELHTESLTLAFDLRYSIGMINILEDMDSELKNQVFTVGIGVGM